MEFNRKQVSTIIEALRASPRGLNVSEASRVTGLNRSTAAKYLEMLYVAGHADMRTFGTSKLYFISQRMPISAFLNFSSDLIIILDRDYRVLNANDSLFEFTGTKREDVVHKYFDHFAFPLQFNPSIMPYIARAIDGKEAAVESYYPKKESGHYFNIKLIPLLFDDGEKGVTIIFEDITEKKLAEKALLNANFELEKKVRERTLELEKANEALQESEERYRVITENSYDVVYSVRLDGTITYISQQIARYGYDPVKSIGRNFFEFIPPAYKSLLAEKFREAASRGISPPLEFKFLGNDGQEYWAEGTGKTIYDRGNRPIFQVGTMRDISERKRGEDALMRSNERYRTLVEDAPLGIFTCDLKGNFTSINRKILEIVGSQSPDFTQAVNILEFEPMIRFGLAGHLRECIDKKESIVAERRYTSYWGKSIYMRLNVTPLRDSAGQIYSVLGIVEDFTERKQAEAALLDSEEKFRALADSSQIGILLIQGEDTLYVNRALADMGGYTVDECLQMKFWEVVLPEMREHIQRRAALRQVGEPGPSRNELKLVQKNGEHVWLDCTAAMLQYRGKPAMMLTAMDITDRKRMEKKLAESEIFLRNVFEGIQDGICVLDTEMNILQANPAMEERYGANLPGMKCYVAFQGRSEACEICPIERAIRLGTTQREVVHDIKGWSEVYAFPMIDCQGKVTGIIEHVRDYNERRRAENALRESEEKFRALIEDIQVMVWAVDENYVCTYINPKCKELLGLAPEEMMGKSPFYFLSPEELGRVTGLVKPCLDAHKPFEVIDYCVERKDGKKVYFKMNAMPIFDQAGAFKGYRGVSREVTKDTN